MDLLELVNYLRRTATVVIGPLTVLSPGALYSYDKDGNAYPAMVISERIPRARFAAVASALNSDVSED